MLAKYMHWLHTQWPAGTVERLPESGRRRRHGRARRAHRRRSHGHPAAQVLVRQRGARRGGHPGRAGVSAVHAIPACSTSPSSAPGCRASPRRSKRVARGCAIGSSRRRRRSRPSPTSRRASRSTPTHRHDAGGRPAVQRHRQGRPAGGDGTAARGGEASSPWRPASIAWNAQGGELRLHHADTQRHTGTAGDHRHRAQRQLQEARLPGRGSGQGLQPPVRPEGVRGQAAPSSSAAAIRRSRRPSRSPPAARTSPSATGRRSSRGRSPRTSRNCNGSSMTRARRARGAPDVRAGDDRHDGVDEERRAPGSIRLLLGTQVTRVEPDTVTLVDSEQAGDVPPQRRRVLDDRPRGAARLLPPLGHSHPRGMAQRRRGSGSWPSCCSARSSITGRARTRSCRCSALSPRTRPSPTTCRPPWTRSAARCRSGRTRKTHLLYTVKRGLGNPSFYYTLAYCILVVVFGIRRIRRRRRRTSMLADRRP